MSGSALCPRPRAQDPPPRPRPEGSLSGSQRSTTWFSLHPSWVARGWTLRAQEHSRPSAPPSGPSRLERVTGGGSHCVPCSAGKMRRRAAPTATVGPVTRSPGHPVPRRRPQRHSSTDTCPAVTPAWPILPPCPQPGAPLASWPADVAAGFLLRKGHDPSGCPWHHGPYLSASAAPEPTHSSAGSSAQGLPGLKSGCWPGCGLSQELSQGGVCSQPRLRCRQKRAPGAASSSASARGRDGLCRRSAASGKARARPGSHPVRRAFRLPCEEGPGYPCKVPSVSPFNGT